LSRSHFRKTPLSEFGILGLECPGNECGEASSFILEISQALKVPDTMIDALANPDHHCCSGTHPQPVRLAMDHQPFVRLALERTDRIPNFIIEDLTPAAGHGIQTSILKPLENL